VKRKGTHGKILGMGLCAVLAGAAQLAMVGEASAITFEKGDVFAGIGLGKIQQWREIAGVMTKVDTLDTGLGTLNQTGMAFDSAGNLYSTNFQDNNITKFDNTGAVVSSPYVSNDPGAHNESVLFDSAGNMYVGQADGTRDIIKRDSTGAFLARFDVSTGSRGTDWIDLDADQQTIYYTSEDRKIRSYDVATDTQLADFATLPGSGNAFALRQLPTGGFLVADQSNIKRLDASGAVIQTYDAPGIDVWFALNLDPDGTSFWSADLSSTHQFFKFDISSGAMLFNVDSDGQGDAVNAVGGLAVFGEITVSNPPLKNNAVPEPTVAVLGSMSLLATGLAISRRRSV